MRKKVHKRKRKTRKELPKGYDSMFEYTLHTGKLKGCALHPAKLSYTKESTYEVDFIHPNDPTTLIEGKGRFRDRAEASKYIWIQASNPECTLVFVFSNPELAMPGAKRRKKCGTKQSHKEWAETNGFTWYRASDTPKEWER